MATALFVVKATIAPEHEDAFNRWYNTEHCPTCSVTRRRECAALQGDSR